MVLGGAGKHFYKDVFENQIYKKKRNLLYFLLWDKTREQAEKILINEIEKQSILGNLDFIPLIGGVLNGSLKTDLERI